MTARSATRPALTTVINGGRVTGFLLSRGPQGVEAFDALERSLGVHPDARRAAEVVNSSRAA